MRPALEIAQGVLEAGIGKKLDRAARLGSGGLAWCGGALAKRRVDDADGTADELEGARARPQSAARRRAAH
jgi:hypothetical protein